MKWFRAVLSKNKILSISFIIFFAIVIAELIVILILNSGLLAYTTDDAYIHLALAENILKGHYGVNFHEYSSPSSSILWPFLLSLFTSFDSGYLTPLIINIIASAGTIYIYFLIIRKIFLGGSQDISKNIKFALLLMLSLIVATNLIGSLFSGMEHSLQIFLTVLIIWKLFTYLENRIIPNWFLAVIVIAPLVRYENLALSFSSLFFLYITGYRKKIIPIFLMIVVLLTGFSSFLISLDLKPLPLSVLQKSAVMSAGSMYSLIENFKENILSPRGGLLLFGSFILVYIAFFGRIKREEKYFAGCFAATILMHLSLGKDGRYIVYLWAAAILIFIFLYREVIIKMLNRNSYLKTALIILIITTISSYYYLLNIFTIPIASNNIYEQQYQMHRFAAEYYKMPVAVNDLGYVSYKNDYYVLDLVGLASEEALNYRHTRKTSGWIDTLSRKHNVGLAMIYDDWFDTIPESWDKIAELHLGKMKMGASRNVVSIYLLNKRKENYLVTLLQDFQKSLPQKVKLLLF